jgi:hypothetical protein
MLEQLSSMAQTAGYTCVVVAAVYAVSKDRIANDLVPKLTAYFETKAEALATANNQNAASQALETHLVELAESRAQAATRPVEIRMTAIESQQKEMSDRIEQSRRETREDFQRLFKQIGDLSTSVAKATAIRATESEA